MDTKQRYDQLVTLVETYMHSLNQLNAEAYTSLFTSDCVINDPYGTSKFEGAAGLRQFFDALTKTWHFFEMRADSIYHGDKDRLAVRWSVSATAQNKRTADFSGISVFTFAEDKIANLDAYWNLGHVLAQTRD